MRYLTATTVLLLLAFIGCAQRAPQSNAADDQTDQTSVHESAPGDDLHDTLNSMPSDDTHAQAMAEMQGTRPSGVNAEIRLPEDIETAWSGVTVRIVDSTTGASERYDILLGEAAALGDSGLTLVAEHFVPDFVMDEDGITSRSADPANPAARVVISEAGADPYEGWLFATMPDIHPFPHDRYRVLLEEGIPAR